ncbi:MAG TPA: alpha/beta hydrolase [Steroidobacteraceae bacterium]|nr:alpha/beta hydrolase [Steroidobacteraceae bacterium]
MASVYQNVSDRPRRSAVRGTALLLALLLARSAWPAQEPWQTLPPTPHLPPALRSGHAEVDGIRMFYAVFGKGQPVLLLHGGLANSNYWGDVIPILVRHHFEVIVADSRGHGRSTRSAAPFSYELMAADTLALLDHLKIRRVDLVGWSDGGIIGLEIARRHPERLRRLFAYGANADPSGAREDIESNQTFAHYLERTRAEYQALSATPADYDAFVAQIQAMWAREPNLTAAELGSIRVPTAIADGTHEEAIKREHTEYMARTISGATLIILPDASHFGALQNPQEFADAVLGFLR